jgi:hypothetical protein
MTMVMKPAKPTSPHDITRHKETNSRMNKSITQNEMSVTASQVFDVDHLTNIKFPYSRLLTHNPV